MFQTTFQGVPPRSDAEGGCTSRRGRLSLDSDKVDLFTHLNVGEAHLSPRAIELELWDEAYLTECLYQLVLENRFPHKIVDLLFTITNQNIGRTSRRGRLSLSSGMKCGSVTTFRVSGWGFRSGFRA
jgi:hypothetical protein